MLELTLPSDEQARFASWNLTLHRFLKESGLFIVKYSDNFPVLKGTHRRQANFSFFRVNEKLIGLDTWDTDGPTDVYWRKGLFQSSLEEVKTVLKIQWQPRPVWDEMTAAGIRVSPWTIFPSREFRLGFFQYSPQKTHRFLGPLSGVSRHGRGDYDKVTTHPPTFCTHGKKIPFADFEGALQDCRWGISLKGKRGTDGKNRREVEFSSCGMPLALNYAPHYPFPFIPGQDFVLLNESNDLVKLEKVDPAPFARASARIWADHFSPAGAAKGLLELISGPLR